MFGSLMDAFFKPVTLYAEKVFSRTYGKYMHFNEVVINILLITIDNINKTAVIPHALYILDVLSVACPQTYV